MKKVLFSLLAFISLATQAQKTAEEVVEKYAKTNGTLDSFNKIISVKMTGAVSLQGLDFPLTVQILNRKGVRHDIDANGRVITHVYYNGTGWQLNRLAGITSPSELAAPELLSLKAQATLAQPLLDYKNKGHKITLLGEEMVEGVKTYKIRLINKEDSREVLYFISATDFLLVKNSRISTIQGRELQVENWYANYKTAGGVKFATTITQKSNGEVLQEISYANIELDVEIDEKIFAK